MNHKPILFSGEMVKALLDGSKTMTRRIIKDRQGNYPEEFDADGWPMSYCGTEDDNLYRAACPYGEPGDLLWVREAFGNSPRPNKTRLVYRASMTEFCTIDTGNGYSVPAAFSRESYPDAAVKWKPSIHMFKKYSRLTLKITDVRIERLQDISEGDAKAEGIKKDILPACEDHPECICYVSIPDDNHAYVTPIEPFKKLWESINGKDSWDANPFVWCVSFEVIHQNVLEYMRSA